MDGKKSVGRGRRQLASIAYEKASSELEEGDDDREEDDDAEYYDEETAMEYQRLGITGVLGSAAAAARSRGSHRRWGGVYSHDNTFRSA